MASIESKIYTVLSAATSLTALTTNIYPGGRPETTAVALPAVVYTRTGGSRVNSFSGFSNLENAMIQLEVYSTSVDNRRAISDIVITEMTGASAFRCLLTDSPFDDYDDMTGEHIRTMDFSIWHNVT